MGWLFKQKMIWVPTLLGMLIIFISVVLVFILITKNTYSFLAPDVPPASKTLVIEGWIPESGLKKALDYYEANNYKYMIITGVPITQWTYSSPFSNMADASAGTMQQLFFRDTIYRAIIPSTVQRDRTYSTAIALKKLLPVWGISADTFDLFSMGAHARRSYLMFTKAFPNARIGLITDTDPSFDHNKWYASSRGFRTVFGELISYFYSFFLFRPNEQLTAQLITEGHYIDEITASRFKTDRYFGDTLTSPLGKDDIPAFRGLPYFPVDTLWKKQAEVKVDTSEVPFYMPTTTERLPLYRKYAILTFRHNDSVFTLQAYQNLDLKKKNPAYNSLFIPFKDLTNGEVTYGGGRYLDIEIPTGLHTHIDFNRAYNPYCAYHERWSCPLPPFENYLKTAVNAGVKKYKSTH